MTEIWAVLGADLSPAVAEVDVALLANTNNCRDPGAHPKGCCKPDTMNDLPDFAQNIWDPP